MTAAIDYNHLKDLPDHEKAKIADILLKSSRGNLGGRRLFLAKQSTPENVCVEFWRVSSTDQRDGFSLKAQEEKAKEYSDLNSLKSSKNWSVSESASQEFDRKKFFEMIDYVTENGIKNVVFDKVDRACRGLRAAVVIEDLIESGVCFHFVRDNLVVNKESAPSEKLRFYLGVVLAKWYIDNLKSEIKKGLHGRLENGYFNAKAPVGYRNVRPEFGKANLEVHPEIGPFIADCFELYKTGNYSKRDLEKIGLERKIKWIVKRRVFDKNGEAQVVAQEKFVTHKALERVLSNPVYCHYRRVSKSSPNYKNCGGSNGFTGSKKGLTGSEGSTDSRGRGSSGSKRSWKSPGGFEYVKNAKWPALISFETFMACQKIRGIRAQSTKLNLAGRVSKPLMQLMKCGTCDHHITGQSKKKASGKIYTYYHCANKRCEQYSVYTEQRRLIAQFSAAFEPFQRFTPKATAAFIKMVQGRISQLSGHSTEKVNQLREKKTQLQDRMAQIHDLYEKGLLSHEEALEFQAIKERELEKIGKDIMLHGISVTQGGEGSWGGVSEVQGDWRIALDLIELLKTSHDFMQLDGFEGQKARIYRSMLSNPTLKDGTIEYRYAKWFADLLLLTGGRNWWTLPTDMQNPTSILNLQ